MTDENQTPFRKAAAFVVLLGGVTAFGLGLFPPWQLKISQHRAGVSRPHASLSAVNRTYYERITSRAFIAAGPSVSVTSTSTDYIDYIESHTEPQINFRQLWVEWVLVLIAVLTLNVGLYLGLGGRQVNDSSRA